MFSSRLHWDLRPNHLARALEARRRSGAQILDLTLSNPTRAGLSYPSAEITGAFGDARALVYEPAPAGLPAAREAVMGYYSAHGSVVEPSRVFLTASTSESYAWLFKLLADPGDEVLAPRPSYPLFEFLAQMESVRIAQYPLVYHDGWSIDTDALTAALTERTRAIVLVNPNNPTGSFVKRGELETLVRLKLPVMLVVISNAVYGWIKAGQKAGYGQRYFAVDFSATDHAAVASAFGIKSWRVTDPSQLQPVLKQALASPAPTLVDIVCQPLHEAKAPVSEWVA